MFPFRPLTARILRKMGGASIEEFASESVEISPSFLSQRPPAAFLPDELARIRSTYEALDVELSHISGGARSEGATVAHAIDGALLSCGMVYKNGHGLFLRSDAPKFFDASVSTQEGECVLATNAICERYFGHWLTESPLLRLIADAWQKKPIQLDRRPYLHQADYERITRLPADPVRTARFERLWIIDDRGINSSRRARTIEIGHRIRASARPTQSIDKVFLLRGGLGIGRNVLNKTELVEFVKGYGFYILDQEQSSAPEIIDTMHHASFVMTVEGSAQKHALLAMPRGSCLIILQPSHRFTAPGKNIADLLGITYAFTVAESHGVDIVVDLNRLGRLFELLCV